MRYLTEFSAREWLKLLPVRHALKQVRNDAWLAIYKNNRVNNLDANKLSLTVTLPTGAFRGTVTDPVSLKAIPFGGVVVQSQNRGAGNFLGTNQSGQVHFGPAQLLIPLASAWRPGAVAWGIVAFYLLVAV